MHRQVMMTIIDRFLLSLLDVVVGIGALALSSLVLLSMWSIFKPCKTKAVASSSKHTLASSGL